METLSADEFKNKYGAFAQSQFEPNKAEEGLFSSIKQTISDTANRNVDILNQPRDGSLGDNVAGGFELAGNTAAGISGVGGDILHKVPVVGPLAKGAGDLIGKGFKAGTDYLGGTKFFQEAAAGLPENSKLEQGLKIASGAGQVSGTILGAEAGMGIAQKGATLASKIPGQASDLVGNIPKPSLPKLGGATDYVKGAIRDVTPTLQDRIDHNLAKALDLTPGDLSNIEARTSNPVGKWMADNNLIGTNKATTQGLIKGFFDTNYKAVRTAIDAVKTEYGRNQVPGYYDALKQVFQTVEGKPGLEETAVKVENLMNKEKITLKDVQDTKELVDDYFKLYDATGDVAQNASKQGVANVREGLQKFIEQEVQKNSGQDIRTLNRNVMTARSLGDAITKRSTKGLTRTHFSTRDMMMGMGLTYFGSPLIGGAYVLVSKLLQSPTARLRWVRYLDSRSDAQKLKISQDLRDGKIPEEAKSVVDDINGGTE